METVRIEWKHLDVDGETCERCMDTGRTLAEEVLKLNEEFQDKGVQVEWFETKLGPEEVAISNALYFNGKGIEELISIEIVESYCSSCSDLVGHKTYCRSVFFEGHSYEDVPGEAIRKAVLRTLGLIEEGPGFLMMPGF